MGVKDFNKLCRGEAPDAYVTIPLEKFKGKRIAIDTHNLMYSRMYTANTRIYRNIDLKINPDAAPNDQARYDMWATAIIEFANTIIGYGITPVFVFDGINMPAKEKTRETRKNDRINRDTKTKELVNELNSIDIMDRTDEDITRLKSLKQSTFYIPKKQADGIVKMLQDAGLPTLIADGDGENLCCALAHEGHVAAVLSNDTDCLLMACPIILTGFTQGTKKYGKTFNAIIFDTIYNKLALPYESFVDMCIMGSCDYNDQLPGIRILSAYKLMKTYGSIEGYVKSTGKDVTPLNHEYCREQFRRRSVKENLSDDYVTVPGNPNSKYVPSLDIDIVKAKHESVRGTFKAMGIEGANYMVYRAALANLPSSGSIGAEDILPNGRVIFSQGCVPIRIVNEVVPLPGYTFHKPQCSGSPHNNAVNTVNPIQDIIKIE